MSDKSPSTGRASRLAISGWPLRRKVALALAVPLLLATAFGGLRVTNDLEQSRNASASADQVTVLRPAIKYLTSAERGMVAAQSSTGASQNELDDALVEIKAAADELIEVRQSAALTADQARQVDTVLDLSRALREEATGPVSPGTWIAQLRQMRSGVTKLITTVINAQLNPEPRLELLSQALGGRFALAQQQALSASERTGRSVEVALFAEFGAERVALDRLAGQSGVADAVIQTLRVNNGQRAEDTRAGGSVVLGNADAYDPYDTLETSLLDAVDKQLAGDASAAQSRALLNALLTLAALAAAIALAFLISRTLVNPIRRVREGALKVAQQDLPDAVHRIRAGAEPGPIQRIDVTTHEEVGQLARAVDDLHQQAVNLAAGEAKVREQVGEMFVTLSRRNTTLINQQLNLIETLERDEEDPKRLESLFRLDHLASRMRRTADSLLILADAPTRSAGWESVSIGETLQAATAGVSDYQRVRIESSLAILVNESAAGDLVHLLTELVDNSLSYSSPNTQVALNTSETNNGVTITVSDTGLGMPADELAAINDKLRSGAEVTPDTARRMGLFVVSRLAQRHGISVSLKANRGSGITAYVLVPNAILPDREHLEPVPVEEIEEDVQVEETVEALAPVAEPTTVDAPDASDEETPEVDSGATGDDEPAVSPAAAAVVDESDPLGLGDSHLRAVAPISQGLPTRERGATLPHLASAGVSLPKADGEEDEPEAPRELKRATGGMALRSKRDLDAGLPPVAAVPDLPADEDTSDDSTSDDATSTDTTSVTSETSTDVVEETWTTPSALDDDFALEASHETYDHAPAAEAEAEPVLAPEPVAEAEPVVEPEPEVEHVAEVQPVVEPEPEPDAADSPESHIASLMAKIRPQRGRLPIPDYDEVDHASILDGSHRERRNLEQQQSLVAVPPLAEEPLEHASWLEDADEVSPVAPDLVGATSSHASDISVLEQPAPAVPAHATITETAGSSQLDEETSINGSSPKSSWLTTDDDRAWSSTEVEAGWERADTVASTHEATNDAGLPVRRPGTLLVPGSVSKPVGAAGRDPEAIRARLSAHKAGVRRGRSTASVPADDK